MDTTKTRIKKLAEKYPHLQKAWKPKIKDDYSRSPIKGLPAEFIINKSQLSYVRRFKSEFLWLPRIDQHRKILKECGYATDTIEYTCTNRFSVKLYDKQQGDLIKRFKAYSLEQALDEAVEWALKNKEINK